MSTTTKLRTCKKLVELREIRTDPTNKFKNKLISLLNKIKAEEGISDNFYKMYPIGAVAQTFYGLPKNI